MGTVIPAPAERFDAQFLESVDKNFRSEGHHDWPKLIDKANQETEVWKVLHGGLYTGWVIVRREAKVAYIQEVFVQPKYRNDETAQLLTDQIAQRLLAKEGIALLPEPPIPPAVEAPAMLSAMADSLTPAW